MIIENKKLRAELERDVLKQFESAGVSDDGIKTDVANVQFVGDEDSSMISVLFIFSGKDEDWIKTNKTLESYFKANIALQSIDIKEGDPDE